MPSGLAEAAAGAGIAISSATKFTGRFGISSSSTALTQFVASSGGDFAWEVALGGTILLAKSLYLVGEITDADDTQWLAVSTLTLPVLTTSMWDAVKVNTETLRLNYKDPTGTSHNKTYDATIGAPSAWALGFNSAPDNTENHATTTVSLTIACKSKNDCGDITDFGDEVYKTAWNEACKNVQASTNTFKVPREISSAANGVKDNISGYCMFYLHLNFVDKNPANTSDSYTVKTTLETSGTLKDLKPELSATLSLTYGQPDTSKPGEWKAYVKYGSNQILGKDLSSIYTTGYKAGWNAAADATKLEGQSSTGYTLIKGPKKDSVNTSETRWTYKPSSYTASAYTASSYTASSYTASSYTASAYTASDHSGSFGKNWSNEYKIWYGSSKDSATESSHKSTDFYTASGTHGYTASGYSGSSYSGSSYSGSSYNGSNYSASSYNASGLTSG